LEADLSKQGLCFYLIMNAWREPLEFELPPVTNGASTWRRWIDTALEPPDEIVDWRAAPVVERGAYQAGDHSVVILVAGFDFDSNIP
jgi:glycogen operon protein